MGTHAWWEPTPHIHGGEMCGLHTMYGAPHHAWIPHHGSGISYPGIPVSCISDSNLLPTSVYPCTRLYYGSIISLFACATWLQPEGNKCGCGLEYPVATHGSRCLLFMFFGAFVPRYWVQNQSLKEIIEIGQPGLLRGLWGHSFQSSFPLELFVDQVIAFWTLHFF